MNKFLLLTSASILAMGMATPAVATPAVQSTLAELCDRHSATNEGGTGPITVDTKVAGTMEVLDTTGCTIELADDAKLEIKDAEFEFQANDGGETGGNVEIFGQGTVDIRNTMLTAQGLTLDITSGDIIVKDSRIDLENSSTTETLLQIKVGSGVIELRNNDFDVFITGSATKDIIDIYATTGDIAVFENQFDAGEDLLIESMGGDVEVVGNSGALGSNLKIEGGDVTVKANDIDVASDVQFDAGGDLQVKDNDFGSSNTPVVQGSPNSCDIKDNTPAVNDGNCPP